MSWLHPLLHDPRLRARWRWLFAALVLVVAWFAFTPAERVPELTGQDKMNHLLAFAALASTAALAFAARAPVLALGLLGYGGFIELVQSFLPTRHGDWADVVADAVGVAAGLLLVAALRHLLGRAR